jgi:hypothetical protein
MPKHYCCHTGSQREYFVFRRFKRETSGNAVMTFGPHGILVHILITGQKICRLRRCQGKGKEMLQEKKKMDKSFRVSCSLLVCFHAILQIATTLLDLSAKGRKSHDKKSIASWLMYRTRMREY